MSSKIYNITDSVSVTSDEVSEVLSDQNLMSKILSGKKALKGAGARVKEDFFRKLHEHRTKKEENNVSNVDTTDTIRNLHLFVQDSGIARNDKGWMVMPEIEIEGNTGRLQITKDLGIRMVVVGCWKAIQQNPYKWDSKKSSFVTSEYRSLSNTVIYRKDGEKWQCVAVVNRNGKIWIPKNNGGETN